MMRKPRGLTLVELMVVVALLGIIVTLAAPSFRNMILMQRLRGVTSELVTDLQFARGEAAARRDFVRLFFKADANTSCYTLYTAPDNTNRCDCLAGAGAACSGGRVEIKTVQVPTGLGVTVKPPGVQAFAFDWRTGGVYLIPTDDDAVPTPLFIIESFIDGVRKLNIRLNGAGRPLVCRPVGSTMSEASCV